MLRRSRDALQRAAAPPARSPHTDLHGDRRLPEISVSTHTHTPVHTPVHTHTHTYTSTHTPVHTRALRWKGHSLCSAPNTSRFVSRKSGRLRCFNMALVLAKIASPTAAEANAHVSSATGSTSTTRLPFAFRLASIPPIINDPPSLKPSKCVIDT